MTSAKRPPLAALLGLLPTSGTLWLALSASLQLLERLLVPATALAVSSDARASSLVALAGLAAVAFAHRLAGAALRARTQSIVLHALTSSLLAQPPDVAENVSAEAEMSWMEGLHAAEACLSQRVPGLLADGPACLLLAAWVAVRQSAAVALGGGAAILVGGASVALVRRVTSAHADKVWQAYLPALEDLVTAIHGRLEVVGNGVEPELLEGLTTKLAAWRHRARASGAISFAAGRVPAVAGVLAAGCVFLSRSQATPADTSLMSLVLLASVVPPFVGLARGVLDLTRDLGKARPVVELLRAQRAPSQERPSTRFVAGDVVWSSVSYAYPGQEPSLRSVSSTWTAGELLGVAGRNGSGKSTLVRLLLGFHSPTAGTITVGRVSIAEMGSDALRGHAAYLVQRPYLPDRMSVREALELLAPNVTPRAAEDVLTRLVVWPALTRRRTGGSPLDVKLGSLSAGEKQRVAIARVLLRPAPLLLLDEPDANLDAAGVATVAQILREESQTRRVLFVAHSAELLAHADRVLEFEDGRLVSERVAANRPRVATAHDAG